MTKIKGLGLFEELKAKGRARKYVDHSVSEFKTVVKEHISEDKTKFILIFKKKGFKFKNGDTLKKIEKDISKIINRKVIVATKIEEEKIKEKKESSLKKGLKIVSEAWEEADRINEDKQERKKYEEINNPKKKGGVLTFLAGAAAGGVVKNKLSPPIITPLNPDDVVYKMEPSGFGWTVWTGKREGGRIVNRQSRRISRATVNMGGKFTVTWSN